MNTLLAHSAAARYLVYNVGLKSSIKSLITVFNPSQESEPVYLSNTRESDPENDPSRYSDSFLAIDRFITDVANIRDSERQRKNTIIVVDADRHFLYGKAKKSKYFHAMRSYLLEKAEQQGLTTIDLDVPFRHHIKKDSSIRFEFSTDAHWNETAHAIIAAKLLTVLNE